MTMILDDMIVQRSWRIDNREKNWGYNRKNKQNYWVKIIRKVDICWMWFYDIKLFCDCFKAFFFFQQYVE